MPCTNKTLVLEAMNAVAADIDARASVRLRDGRFEAVPSDGYEFIDVCMRGRWSANIKVGFFTRALKNRDFDKDGSPILRGMDEELFFYSFAEKEVLSGSEYDKKAERTEHLYDILDDVLRCLKEGYEEGPPLPEAFVETMVREIGERYSLTEKEKSWLFKSVLEERNRKN